MSKKAKLICIFALSLCLFLGLENKLDKDSNTINATLLLYNTETKSALLEAANGDLWAISEIELPRKNGCFVITYTQENDILSLTCNGQELFFK